MATFSSALIDKAAKITRYNKLDSATKIKYCARILIVSFILLTISVLGILPTLLLGMVLG